MDVAAPAVRVTLIAAVLVGLAGCTAAPPAPTSTEPTSTEPTSTAVPFDERAADAIYPGDCFDVPDVDSALFDPGERIPCDQPHDVEVYALLDQFDGTALLPDEEMEEVVRPLCIEKLDPLVDSPLTELPLVTSYTGWLAENEDVVLGDIACTVATRNDGILSGSILENDPHDLLGDWVLLRRLDVGDCFTLGEQGNLGLPTACASGALMFLGTIEAVDGPYPGTDELRAQRGDGCLPLLAQGLDPDTLSGTIPTGDEWELGLRTITCDAAVA